MNDATDTKSISKQITRVFALGATALLFFYAAVFNLSLLYTENATNERRLKLIAPFHAGNMTDTSDVSIKIDPLLTIYKEYSHLPNEIKKEYDIDSRGIESIHVEEDEYNIFGFKLNDHVYYAVEKIDAIEWNDFDFALLELLLFGSGMLIFAYIAWQIFNATTKIAYPFHSLTEQLHNKECYNKIDIDVSSSIELADTVAAVNNYREAAKKNIEREKNFTRYISHEFRTPMSVIKGCVSVLRKQLGSEQKQLSSIHDAVLEMESLTNTFLTLSRKQDNHEETTLIDERFINSIINRYTELLSNNQTNLKHQLEVEFHQDCDATLIKACIHNLLNNAINCSLGGNVSLFISPRSITVIDDGIGLAEKPRGYEGFGIGLLLVKDICQRYGWAFSLFNNQNKGCTATITFE